MDGRASGSRGTDTQYGRGLDCPRADFRVGPPDMDHGPISANLEVADAIVPMATARCVGNGVITMSTNSTYRRVVCIYKLAARLRVPRRNANDTSTPDSKIFEMLFALFYTDASRKA